VALTTPFSVVGRRQDLAEVDTEREIGTPRPTLEPGHWEIRAMVGPGQYVESIVNNFRLTALDWRKDHPGE